MCIISGVGLSSSEAEPEKRIWVSDPENHRVSKIMAPKDVHVLILGICEYVTGQSKKGFVGMIESNISKWEYYFGLSE